MPETLDEDRDRAERLALRQLLAGSGLYPNDPDAPALKPVAELDARRRELEQLVEDVVEIAKAEGYPLRGSGGRFECSSPGNIGTVVMFADDRGVHFEIAGPAERRASIVYDVNTRSWVGTAPDSNVPPRPGEPLPKCTARTAIAGALIEAIYVLARQ